LGRAKQQLDLAKVVGNVNLDMDRGRLGKDGVLALDGVGVRQGPRRARRGGEHRRTEGRDHGGDVLPHAPITRRSS
jgi:hypothetical protein